MHQYLCERCGGIGQQPAGCYSIKTNAYDSPAGVCEDCNGEGYLGPEKTMDLELNAINQHCASNAAKQAREAKLKEVKEKYQPLALRKTEDATGKVVSTIHTSESNFITVFTDGTYLAVSDERDTFGGFDINVLSLRQVREIGLMQLEDKKTLEELDKQSLEAAREANWARDLKNVVTHFGVDKIRELIGSGHHGGCGGDSVEEMEYDRRNHEKKAREAGQQ